MHRPVVVFVAAFAVLASSASALSVAPSRIEPQRGIRFVELGDKPPDVRDALGRPSGVTYPRHDVVGRHLRYRYGRLIVDFTGSSRTSTVFSVSTTDRGDRTRTGVGVGSTEEQVRRGLHEEHCRSEFRRRHCYIGAFLPGRRVTDVLLNRGRVTRVVIGFVVD
jgi:hypothetical protein